MSPARLQRLREETRVRRCPAPTVASLRRGAAALACVFALSLVTLGASAADPSAPAVRWESSAYRGRSDLYSVEFWGGARGFAVGAGGTVITSRDGGASWTTASVDATADLRGLCFDPAGGVHAVGAAGTIISSSDGISWRTGDSGAMGVLTGIDFADPAHGWAVGEGGTILVTSDGGSTWDSSAAGVDPGAALSGVDFADPLTGWVWGGSGAVLATRDGGLTWSSTIVSAEETVCAGCFTSASEGWVGGTNGLIARTPDGGATWAFRSIPVTGTVMALDFCDALHGALLVEKGGVGTAILQTADGGETWSVVHSSALLRSVAVADALHLWAVGDGGALLRTVGVDAPAMAIETTVVPPPLVTSARAMPDGTVLIGWSDVPGASGYVVRRSVAGGPFDTIATLGTGAAPGLRDPAPAVGEIASYVVSTRFPGSESAPGEVATAAAVAQPHDPVEGSAPSGMSCTDCHVVHTTGPMGDPAQVRPWCLDCHPVVQRDLAGPDASTRHDLLAADAGAEHLGLSCTDCHSPHASSETTPLIDPDHPDRGLSAASTGFCLSCHDGQLTQHVLDREAALGLKAGVPVNVAAAWGSAEHTASMDVHGFGAGDPRLRPGTGFEDGVVLQCADCHEAHGSTNRWTLRESTSIPGSGGATGLLVEPVGSCGADLRLFCAACHLLDLHPPVGSGGADLSRWPIDCTACHRHGSGL